MNDKKARLDSGIEPEKQQLKDAIGYDDPEVLGYGVMYTVGYDFNCIVPRDWLLERAADLGIPEWLIPNESRPHYAYDRAIKMMGEHWLDEYRVVMPRLDSNVEEKHRVSVDLKEGDGSRIWHVRADTFYDEEESGEEGGKWVRNDLGYFTYHNDSQTFIAREDDELDVDDPLRDVWNDVSNAGAALHRKMQSHHIAGDIRGMMHAAINDYSRNVIKLQRSVYLFPPGMADFVEQMATLYADINLEFKSTGEPVAIRTFEVLDTDDKQEWIQHRVEETLRDNLDGILESAFEQFDEGEAAETIVKLIKQNLSGSAQTAETYNSLLNAEISVEKVLAEQKQEVTDSDKEDIIDTVLAQTDIADF